MRACMHAMNVPPTASNASSNRHVNRNSSCSTTTSTATPRKIFPNCWSNGIGRHSLIFATLIGWLNIMSKGYAATWAPYGVIGSTASDNSSANSSCIRCFTLHAVASTLPSENDFSPQHKYTASVPIPTMNDPCAFTQSKNTAGSVHSGQLTPLRNHSITINSHTKHKYPNICGRSVNDKNASEHISPAGTNPALQFPDRSVP